MNVEHKGWLDQIMNQSGSVGVRDNTTNGQWIEYWNIEYFGC